MLGRTSSNLPATLSKQMSIKGITYYQLSKETNIPHTTIQNYLAGRNKPSKLRVQKLAEALGIKKEELTC